MKKILGKIALLPFLFKFGRPDVDKISHPRRPKGSQSRRDEKFTGKIGTGVKFSSKERRAPGNIPLTDEFQSK